MPPRNVVPKPVQKPHPPLWVACSRRDTILLAAEKGIGALTFAFIDPEEAAHWVHDYEHDARREVRAGRLGRQPAGRLRDADDAAPRRGRGDRAAASRAPTSSATRSATSTCSASTSPARPTCGTSTSSAAASSGYSPEAVAAGARGGAARRQGRAPATRPACAARSARPTRSASTSAATRRPASTR